MPKMPVALVTSLPEKGWVWGTQPIIYKNIYFLKETDSVQSVKQLQLWE